CTSYRFSPRFATTRAADLAPRSTASSATSSHTGSVGSPRTAARPPKVCGTWPAAARTTRSWS
ncbi:MAG: hypothetical protein AVDCRST_MAG11-2340, partial [uncultured Gemmatimonadaceae bacterium]